MVIGIAFALYVGVGVALLGVAGHVGASRGRRAARANVYRQVTLGTRLPASESPKAT